MNKGHKIKNVKPGSIAEELEIEAEDILYRVNGHTVKDIFDYQYYTMEEFLTIIILKSNGEEWELEIEKDEEEDLGIEFEESLMDEYQSCQNKCMFCFIDQMPPNMRDTLYFKDDDARLSFLQGNYITLTNMKDEDLERVIRYHLSPVNISVHTTNPTLRCEMLHNRFAGDVLKKIGQLYEADIQMNSQIVLCKGYNDGKELEQTVEDLSKFLPHMKSLSVVPVGLTKFRTNLVEVDKFTKEEALTVLNTIHKWQDKLMEQHGTRFVFASDEWYILAGVPIPEETCYEGYGQIENGVGMVRSLISEFEEYLSTLQGDHRKHQISLATGKLAAPIMAQLVARLQTKFPFVDVQVYEITNYFFGTDITVAGLLTGTDIIEQLKGKNLGEYLLLPDVLLRSQEEVLLDDITVKDIEIALQKKIHIVQSDGTSLINNMIDNI